MLTFVRAEPEPVVIGEVPPGAVLREVPDTLLRQHAHVDLQAHQRKHSQRKHRQDYHVAQILHRLYHSADDGLQTWVVVRDLVGLCESLCYERHILS